MISIPSDLQGPERDTESFAKYAKMAKNEWLVDNSEAVLAVP